MKTVFIITEKLLAVTGGLLCHAHNPREDKLVIGLADGCLVSFIR